MSGEAAYEAAIDKWVIETNEKLLELQRRSAMKLCEAVVVGTPVMTGFLRSSWWPAIGHVPAVKPGAVGGGLADAAALLANLKTGDVFYFANTAIYARRVEYGFVGEDSLGRHYNQAGRFYMTNQLAKWQSFVNAAALDMGLTLK